MDANKTIEEMYMGAMPHDEAKRVVGHVAKQISKTWKCVEQFVVRSRKATEEEAKLRKDGADSSDNLSDIPIELKRKTTI